MFPASFSMFPLATTPVVPATLLRIDADVVLGALVVGTAVLFATLVRGALRLASSRATTHTIRLRRHAI